MPNNKGIALIIVLWISVILSSLVLAGAYLMRLEIRQAMYSAKEMQLLGAAVTAMEKVKSALIEDNSEYDSLKASWKTMFNDQTELNGIKLQVSVVDGESKFNLNTATRDRLENYPPFNSTPAKDTLIDSLIDWKDTDSDALPNGAENDYYRVLPNPGKCKNKPLDCIEELSEIRGFEDTQLLNAVMKYATVDSDGKINVNTAPVETLVTLPGIDYQLAQAIITRRNGNDMEQGTEDDLPYNNIVKVQEVVEQPVYDKIKNLITVKSSYFKVTIEASSGKFSKMFEVLLYRQGNSVRTLRWKEM